MGKEKYAGKREVVEAFQGQEKWKCQKVYIQPMKRTASGLLRIEHLNQREDWRGENRTGNTSS